MTSYVFYACSTCICIQMWVGMWVTIGALHIFTHRCTASPICLELLTDLKHGYIEK